MHSRALDMDDSALEGLRKGKAEAHDQCERSELKCDRKAYIHIYYKLIVYKHIKRRT